MQLSKNVTDYQAELDCCLNKIKIPMSLIGVSVPMACCDTTIDEYYDNVSVLHVRDDIIN